MIRQDGNQFIASNQGILSFRYIEMKNLVQISG